jgi:hypothetical protein
MRCHLAALALVGLVIVASPTRGAAPAPKPTAQPKGPGLEALKFSGDVHEALAAARWLENAYGRSRPPEAVRMLIAIARGSQMGPGEGWFGPCATRYTWDWLARLHQTREPGIPLRKFRGPTSLFRRLDRDQDGRITAADLDWSENSPYLRQAALVDRLFLRINSKRDGKITAEQWQDFFKAAAGPKGFLAPQDLRDLLLAAPPPFSFAPPDRPSQAVLVRGLFAGEIGSLNEGPAVDTPAPDFTLKTADGKQAVQFSRLLAGKPIVLVFGNFTCGPFRRISQGVEELYQRYKDRATFLGVYVREAHPTDGWAMTSNQAAGIAVKQPTTYRDRAAVCTQFCKKVRPSFPYVVDEINDPAGHAYSGMPGRLYVIDPKGKVAYKCGRGPFGFKVGELEQALVMALLEFPATARKP